MNHYEQKERKSTRINYRIENLCSHASMQDHGLNFYMPINPNFQTPPPFGRICAQNIRTSPPAPYITPPPHIVNDRSLK